MAYWDWTYLLLGATFIFAIWTQFRINSTFKKFAQVGNARNFTAEQVAGQILAAYGINDITIQAISGNLTDNYNPRDKTLNLSQSVYGSDSIAAIGVAAHESGHAIQHARGYAPIKIRNFFVPIANIGTFAAFPIIILGFFLGAAAHSPWHFLITLGILLYAGIVAFHLFTLPVEFDASGRALKILGNGSYLSPEELKGARKVLTAAGMTYVAAAVSAVVQLIRLIIISRE